MWPISLDAGESFERAVGKAALDAAAAMVTEGQANFAEERGVELIAPVATHVANVQAIGIHRLRYRPHTEPTLKWFREKAMQCDAVARRYAEMRGKSKTEPAHAADGAVGWTAASGGQYATSR
jgi:hypothetical protein